MKTLEQKVMARVRRIYYLRKFMGPTAMKAYGLVVLTLTLSSLVSLVNVYANMPSLFTPMQFASFLMNAALQTELAVQLILLGLATLIALFIRDVLATGRMQAIPTPLSTS